MSGESFNAVESLLTIQLKVPPFDVQFILKFTIESSANRVTACTLFKTDGLARNALGV